MKLSDKLIELRKEKNWSQEDFAEKLDVSRQAISRWENGTALPDAQNILRISKLFNVSADYLLNDEYENGTNIPEPQIPSEDAHPPLQKKKSPLRYIIPILCFIALAALIVILMLANNANKAHSCVAPTAARENEVSPTCASEGSYDEVIYCADCGNELSRTSHTTAKLAHTLKNSIRENEVAPTCTSAGSYDEVIYCTDCKAELLRMHKTQAQLTHQFKNRKCIACGEDQPSEGLLYMSSGNGTCTVYLGDCTDEDIVIPSHSPSGDKVTQIKAYAFAGYEKVKSIKIPETVTVIGEGAFQDCINLESVNLPSKITMIYSYTFCGCKNLKGTTIPSGVQYIGEEAFADCLAFESIVIPARVTKIGAYAFRSFSGCSGSIIFEISDGWKIYDSSEEAINIIDFKNSASEPVMYLTFKYCEYVWKRG
jgi:transcriptional regulator with XRE-family HTH domain